MSTQTYFLSGGSVASSGSIDWECLDVRFSEFGTAPGGWVDLIGDGPAMRRVRSQMARIAPYFRVALVTGEAGAGKEVVARALHRMSPGGNGPFVVCAAAMLDQGGGAGGAEWRDGVKLLEAAQGGTLFLDEVCDMTPAMQAKLLRMLKRHQETRPGGLGGTRRYDARIIAATSRDVHTLSRVGLFQQDLHQRLAVLEVAVPALRERAEDIAGLAGYFVRRESEKSGKGVEGISEEAMGLLREYAWRGNVRELARVVGVAVGRAEGVRVEVGDLKGLVEAGLEAGGDGGVERLQEVVERHVVEVLTRCGGNKLRAAERLGISRSTLYRMLEAGR